MLYDTPCHAMLLPYAPFAVMQVAAFDAAAAEPALYIFH